MKSSEMKTKMIYHGKTREMGKLVLALGILLLGLSCGKDIDEFIPRASVDVPGDINQLMGRLQADLAHEIDYTFTISCHGEQVFEIDKDLVLVVPDNFIDPHLNPCQAGPIDMHVTVCDTKGEILVAGLPTVSEGKLLESRIEFNIGFHNEHGPLSLNHGKQIRFLVEDPDPRERMELFYGAEDQWIQADQNPQAWDNVSNNEWVITTDSINIITGFGYEGFSDSTDWINVDVFFDVPKDQRTAVCVELPEEFTNANTAVYMVFNDYNSVLGMRGDSELKQFCEPYGAAPVGYRVTFVVISEKSEGDYYFTTKSTTITHDHIESLEPLKTPYEEILQFLKDL